MHKKPFGLLLGLSLLLAGCNQNNASNAVVDKSEAFSLAPANDTFKGEAIEGEYVVVLKENAYLGGISAQSIGNTKLTAQNITSGLGLSPQGLEIQNVYNSALKGFGAKLTPQHLETLAKHPAVASVEKNIRVYGSAVQNTDRFTWGLDRIDQRENQLSGTYDPGAVTGKGVVAYIIDSGIHITHNEFGGRAEWAANTIDDIQWDCHGHGTHVAGTVGGRTYGVAKDVTLVSVKSLDCDNSGSLQSIVGGIDWVRENHFNSNYRNRRAVINMSINTHGTTVLAIDRAVRSVVQSGIPLVNSAGNQNSNACQYGPANNPEAIVVGAMDRAGSRSEFSNWGNCLDIFAPGSDIYSASPQSNFSTVTMDGTSMAAPHVAGVVALLLERYPDLTPAEIEQRLIADSTKDLLRHGGVGSPNRMLFIDRDAMNPTSPEPVAPPVVGPTPPTPPAPEPTKPTVTLDRSYRGLMLHGRNAYLHSRGKEFAGGPMVFEANGPAGTDFDIYLQKLGATKWENVAYSATVGSKERISYEGTKGIYRLVMRATNGKGYIDIRSNVW